MSIFSDDIKQYYAKVVFSSKTCTKYYYKRIPIKCKCCGQVTGYESVCLSTETMPRETFINNYIDGVIKLKNIKLTKDERCQLFNDLMSDFCPGKVCYRC